MLLICILLVLKVWDGDMHLISPKTEETVLLRSAKEDNKTKKGHKNRKKNKGLKST